MNPYGHIPTYLLRIYTQQQITLIRILKTLLKKKISLLYLVIGALVLLF